MAWPGRDINWQEEFGVASKEELQARLKKVAELETQNATFNTTIEAQKGELNTVKATLASIEEKLGQQQPPPRTDGGAGSGSGTVEIPSVVDDENAAFAVRMAPVYKQNMENTAMIVEDQTLRRLAMNDPRFPKMEKDIRALIAATPLQFRANTDRDKSGKMYAEQVIENAYYVVKGRFADNIVQDTLAGKGEFFVEPARASGNTGTTPNTPDPATLTDDDRKVIARMGISEKTYIDVIKGGGPNMGGALSNKTSL